MQEFLLFLILGVGRHREDQLIYVETQDSAVHLHLKEKNHLALYIEDDHTGIQ